MDLWWAKFLIMAAINSRGRLLGSYTSLHFVCLWLQRLICEAGTWFPLFLILNNKIQGTSVIVTGSKDLYRHTRQLRTLWRQWCFSLYNNLLAIWWIVELSKSIKTIDILILLNQGSGNSWNQLFFYCINQLLRLTSLVRNNAFLGNNILINQLILQCSIFFSRSINLVKILLMN